MYKKCKGCGAVLHISRYNYLIGKNNKKYYHSYCRECFGKKYQSDIPLKYQTNRGKIWTKDDDEYLITWHGKISITELAYALGRSKRTIVNRAWELKNRED